MLRFTITPPGHAKLIVTINPDNGTIETNMDLESISIKNPKMCNKCQQSKLTHRCNLLQALVPILTYFSDFLSYEEVLIEYEEKNCFCRYKESAQRAGFILCLYAMFHSSCDYFSQFSFILKYYRVDITYEIFMHLMLTTAVLKRQVDLHVVHDQIDIFSEVKAMANEFRNRLSYILEDARSIEKKDAAVNALNIIFSLNSLTADYLREYYQKFCMSIQNIQMAKT